MSYTSIIRLLKNVPLSPDYSDTLTFPGVSDQTNYFLGKTAYSFVDCMYVREGVVIIPNQAGQYRTCNYVMYQNPDFPNKWFYGFITGVTYIADGTTRIDYVEDFLQTWWFNLRLGQCMVAREHVNNDSIGANLKEEPVSIGDYKNTLGRYIPLNTRVLIVASAVSLTNFEVAASADKLQGSLAGLGFYVYGLTESGLQALNQVLDELATAGKSNAIVDMWVVPRELINGSVPLDGGVVNDNTINNEGVSISVSGPTSIDGYTPKNNKLYTYPYCGLEITNNSGQTTSLRYEMFNDSYTFKYQGTPMPSGRMLLIPQNYAGVTNALEYSIALGNYPHASWTQDVYSNWLATENINWNYEGERRQLNANFAIDAQLRSGIKGIIGGASSGGYSGAQSGGVGGAIGGSIGGAISGFVQGVDGLIETAITNEHNEELAQSAMAQEREVHSIIPPSAKGTIGNDTTLSALGYVGFYIYRKHITASYAKSIDNFFDLFGYRVDVVKTPNISGRQSWNYVQTIGAIVKGDAPLYAKEGFRKLLNRGIRFWHNEDIGNYNLPNNIV